MDITATDWAQLSPLVDELLDLAPPKRVEWLRDNAAAKQLSAVQRQQLEALIAQSEAPETGRIFDTLPALARVLQSETGFSIDDQVGPYSLICKIGVGGMSEVWRAKRSDGAYEREVALKLPYAHASVVSREHFIARMARERDLLAKLEHPNIARFYDAGVAKTTLGAQPYLALEYVDGVPITQYANEQHLSIRARCELFLQVLEAVQYAHQRLVVHRDLKPSNILVRQSGSFIGKVALLDFGVAKVLADDAATSDASQITREMGRAVTLAYASPEQLLGESIGTASDVFSAGVLFYELLCGERPFSGSDRNLLSLLAAMDSPVALMVAKAKSHGEAHAQFAVRSARAYERELAGDLQAIVNKTLRHDSRARYEAIAAFRDDLRCYLRHEPVQARQGVLFYRLLKFAQRHCSLLVVSTVAVVTIAIVGTIAWRSERAEEVANVHVASIETLFDGLLNSVDPELAESKSFSVKEVLDQISASLSSGRFVDRQTALAVRVADLYEAIGDHEGAKRLLDKYLVLARDAKSATSEISAETQAVKNLVSAGNIAESRRVLDRLLTRAIKNPDQMWRRTLVHMNVMAAESNFRDVIAIAQKQRELKTTRLGVDPLTLALIEQALGFAHAQLGEKEASRRHYMLAGDLLSKMGARAGMSSHYLKVQLAQIAMHEGEYQHAITEATDALTQLHTRYAHNHRALFNAHYVKVFSLIFSGQHEAADGALAVYLDATSAHPQHRTLARMLHMRLDSYRGRCDAVLKEIERELGELQAASLETRSSNWSRVNSLRRLRTECWLRGGLVVDAMRELEELKADEKSQQKDVPMRRAYTEALLGIAYSMSGERSSARALFKSAMPIILATNGEHDTAFIAMTAYDSLFGGDSVARARAADLVTKHLLWQDGALALVARLRATGESHHERLLPFVF